MRIQLSRETKNFTRTNSSKRLTRVNGFFASIRGGSWQSEYSVYRNNNTISRCIAILHIVANVATNSVRNHRLLRLPQLVTNVAERRWQSSAGIGYGRVQRRHWFPIYPWLNPLRIFFPTRFSVLGQGCSRIAVAKQKKEKKRRSIVRSALLRKSRLFVQTRCTRVLTLQRWNAIRAKWI